MIQKKRILIDATTVTAQIDGLSHCIINLLKNLPSESFEYFDYTVLVNRGINRPALQNALENPLIRKLEVSIAPIGLKRELGMYKFLKSHRKDYDLIHITSNNYPFVLRGGIATVHDITFKRYFDNPKYTFKLAVYYMDFMIRNAIRKSKGMIAVSHATKTDLVQTYKLKAAEAAKIRVIRLGWEHLITEMDASESATINRDDTPSGFLLYVGTNRIHKNISKLLLAFRESLPKLSAGKKLVIIGSDKYLKQSDLDIISDINRDGERMIFTGYLSQANVEWYFRNADAYIFPSLSEGFGLGSLEAFHYGIPLLCSNVSSLPEIAGDAALYFNPHDHMDIARAIEVFYSDPSLAPAMIARGKERLKHFSWKKNAEETVAYYREHTNVKLPAAKAFA